jgi:hypothetical protein
MSNHDFVKGECRHCAGHLEFPANATGQTVPCPHCGQPTELVAPVLPNKINGSPHIWPGIILVICLLAAGLAGAYLYLQKASRGSDSEASPLPSAPSNTPTVSATAPVVAPEPQAQETTNDFGIMPFKLEKTPGSSLVYVTGAIRNLSDRQRFGVKITFGLFDTNDNAIGSATDYQSVLEPNGEWHFKALVMESKAVSARFDSIVEDK